MNDRERFRAIMDYGKFDRGVIQDFQYWSETLPVWYEYGLPRDVDWGKAPDFFGFDRMWDGVSVNGSLYPGFEYKVLSEDENFRVVQQGDGSIDRESKHGSTIPEHMGHTLVDRASWEKHFKWRLDASNADRVPKDIAKHLAANADSVRTWPLNTWCGSMFGQLRNWMGLEGVSYIQYDDPDLFAEMIRTIGDCQTAVLERFLPMAREAGVTFDYGLMWEDMSYAQGPLLGVPAFKQHLVPQYKRISALLKRYGCDKIMLDSDGDTRLLLPLWLEAGVNIAFPLEVGTWGVDAVKIRKQFGRELRICGGFDKHVLARTTDDIAREIDRLAPLVEEGGFIPFCDHRVPPDVSFSNYLFYVERARKVWGRGLANLRPTGKPDAKAPLYGKPYDYTKVLGEAFVPKH